MGCGGYFWNRRSVCDFSQSKNLDPVPETISLRWKQVSQRLTITRGPARVLTTLWHFRPRRFQHGSRWAGSSRASIHDAFVTAGLPTNASAVWSESRSATSHFHLIEIAEYVRPDDARIAAVADSHGEHIIRIVDLGGYAVPIGLDATGGT